ncbi:two-component regulator propeller domain-containing protein [Prolixibacter sp. SD074]|uniref:ligand-binding sensor domain-containing protein n=1 Tax=Prolixibacter sp. SD074 TaxID=2652391 RepID=UPI001281DBA9|nr:sensor histidine kinase [Prolixibacter sp. SD074]GET28744.1 hybrid sensor histidine kinase/response regulator [Prolixibacter sp. SD074]
MTRITWIVIALLVSVVQLMAQQTAINFSNISTRRGMSSNWVTSLCRDSDGFIWVGTNRGLNRFDGYDIATFEYRTGDSTSISDNYISCIAEDDNSNLWVGTRNGVNIKSVDEENFHQISLFNYNAFNCNDINNIGAIYVAHDSTVYLGTHEGFFTYRNGTFRHHLIDSTRFSAHVNNVMSFAEDIQGNIWMGTFTRNLICYRPGNGAIESIPLPPIYEGKYVNGLQKLFIDNDSLLWIGSQAGLYVYDLRKKKWQETLNQVLYREVGNKVISGIQEDKDGIIWLATDGAGIFLFDKQQNTVQNLAYKEGKSGTISTNGLFSMLIDKDDIVWLGTYKQGLDFYKPSSKKFRLIQNDPEIDNSLSFNDVDCCIEDRKGNIWIGTNGGGINILDRKTHRFRYITVENSGPNGLTNDIVVSLFEDHQKNIWIGTYFGGLDKYNPTTGKFNAYKYNADDSTSLSDDRIWSIFEDRNNRLWVGTLGGGLNVFNPETESFKRYTNENSNLSGNYINHISQDSKNRLWICTSDGLSIYDPKKDDFDVYFTKYSTDGTPFLGPISSSFEDSRGWHWLCSVNGLIKFSPESLSMVVINRSSGLVANPVYRILEDNQGNLWVSSSRGITKIHFSNIENDTTFTTSLRHFDETDGLQGLEFSETASLKTRNGELLFGGVNGVNIFRPEEIQIDKTVPGLIFTNLRVLNSDIKPEQEFNHRVLLNKPLNHTDQIVLKYSENLFSVEFAALTYLYPEKNKYRYQLEGFDNSWFETDGTANFATFTNLNNGDYILHVKGSNADGTWNEEGISLKIKVLPPFWKSWYAMAIYALVLTISLLGLRYVILFRERMNVELEMERSEAKRIHELDSMKLKFFTNISHEFRTPLTLIISPVEKLLPRFKGEPEEIYLNHIYQNSKKLINMINQLLDFRKMDDKGLSYNPSWGNIIEFITATVSSFNDLSYNKNIELRQITDLREYFMVFDKDKLEKVLFNLLSNAFKFTPLSGLVIVQVSLEVEQNDGQIEKKNNLVIRVKDNGVGIQPENIDKIFTRFYQEENGNGAREKGTGIGLSLVKEYVQLHGGKITVDSAPNIGSSFNVFLPVTEATELETHEVRGALREVKFTSDEKIA